MKPLQIDFSGRSRLFALNPSDPVHLLSAGALVLGVLLLVSGVGMSMRLNTQSAQLKQSIDRIESTQRARDETSAQTGQLSVEETAEVNDSVMHLNYPWLDLFKSLEGHFQPGTTLVSVETGVGRQSTKIVIEAPGIDDALTFLQSIKMEPLLARITLVKQESLTVGENQAAMRFTLDVPTVAAAPAPARRSGS